MSTLLNILLTVLITALLLLCAILYLALLDTKRDLADARAEHLDEVHELIENE